MHLNSDSTCWTLIRGAARGQVDDREDFARRYLTVVRTFLASRWQGSPLLDTLEEGELQDLVAYLLSGGDPESPLFR